MSDPKKGKWVRVSRDGSLMKKFHIWLNNELKLSDSFLPDTINGGISDRSILNAINIHVRKQPFSFIKADIKRFFESIPQDRIVTLFCGLFNCDKLVSQILASTMTFPGGPLSKPEGVLALARGLHVSSRVAIWASIDFFRILDLKISEKFNHLKPRISFYVDDVGISLLTTNKNEVNDFIAYLNGFIRLECPQLDFLALNPEKTKPYIVSNPEEYVEYLGSRIFMYRKDISQKSIDKGRYLYRESQKEADPVKKFDTLKQISSISSYRKWIRSSCKK
ncbi:hypothetical protein KBB25_02690 [Candidatus Gracilibacteria bacterium]|nr:hypothetical protein [Candidatus Gracilibacteria bacterium]